MSPLGARGRRRKRRFGRTRHPAVAREELNDGDRGDLWSPALWGVDDDPPAPLAPASAAPALPARPQSPAPPAPPVHATARPEGEPLAAEPPLLTQPLRATGSTRVAKRRQRARRRRVGGAGVVAGLGLVVALIAAFAVNRAVSRDDEPPRPAARTQRTMLLQIRARDGLARSSTLIAHDPATGRASMLLVPPGVLALAPGLGTIPFEQALQLRGASASRGALSELLGVTVDHDWTLTETAFVALIDRLGGLRVDVDVDVIVAAARGQKVLLVSAGAGQQLTGAQALAFATYIAPGEDQTGALPRFQEVLEGVLDRVDSASEFASLIETITHVAPGTMPPSGLADFLAQVAADRRDGAIAYASLPVVPIDNGARQLRYRLDEVPALELVNRNLAASIPEGRFDGDKRVIIQNGVGTPGVTTTAQQKLSAAGFDIVKTGNANRFDYATSVILVRDATAASSQLGTQVAQVLGLKPAAIRVNPQRNTVTDVIVILGRDYRR